MNKSKRFEVFESYKTHAWLRKVYARFKTQDLAMAHAFIEANDYLPKGEFEYAVNRMFMDKARPKLYKEILELLTCCNSALVTPK